MTRQRAYLLNSVAICVMVGLSLWAWPALPADVQIPIHWDINFEADGFAGKIIGLVLMPSLSLAILAFLWGMPKFASRRRHVLQSTKAQHWFMIGISVCLTTFHASAILFALGRDVPMQLIVPVTLGGLFTLLGNFLGKIRSNFWFGIRTPWTLSSELVWTKTHRLIGKLWVVTGLGTAVLGIVQLPYWSARLLVFGVISSLVLAFIYSYLVWKKVSPRLADQHEKRD